MLKYAIYRFIFVFFMLLVLATFGLSMILLSPVYTWYYHRELKFLKYARFWYPSYLMLVTHLWRLLQNRDYRRHFKIGWSDPPKSSSDLSRLRINDAWKGDLHTCSGCISCCEQLNCVFLDREKKQCRSYHSFFWNYFNCGRYPESQFQIDHYKCPKWKMKEYDVTLHPAGVGGNIAASR